MKTSLFLILVIVVLVFGCERENGNSNQDNVTGKVTSYSSCKNGLKSAKDMPDNMSCAEYLYDSINNKLEIRHVNAAFNCCPNGIYCDISLKGDTIIIKESEKSAQCKCDCLYDLDIEVNGVERKKYQIKFVEPYTRNQARLTFEIDLVKEKIGSVCVIRREYPWSQNSL